MTDKMASVRAKRHHARPAPVVLPEILMDDNEFGPPEPVSDATEIVIVARGVVDVPHSTEKGRFLWKNEITGEPVFASRMIRYHPGCEIVLPVHEAERLIALGRVTRPGENPQVGRHPDIPVHPGRPEDPDPVAELRPIITQLDDGR
jgi:hypothetical protein